MFIHEIEPGLALKLIDYQDTDRLYNLIHRSRTFLRRWLAWVDHTTKPADTYSFVDASLKGYVERKSLTTVILYDHEIAGVVSFHAIDWQNKKAEIGYWLGEDYAGKGIMPKAVSALIDYAFFELLLNRVEIRAAVFNKSSRRVAEKLNFVEEGTIRGAEWLGDHFVDHVVYGMLVRDWVK
ncbi:ribosomal-protein-serine acetyltransferase [Natronobacillus azotifigens]|uniref:GNAT family protein n=1 Tax=Natronobacillus azotifigens TaxID=472978 RepID=A0A9J6R7R5_9BACI|nr:GNAT family protein [Natronobacillus azotifigens]MCZ0701682.1 GNAT family protein [Natronobacillus azotifigens]